MYTVEYSFHFDWPFSGGLVFLSDQCTCMYMYLCGIQGICQAGVLLCEVFIEEHLN